MERLSIPNPYLGFFHVSIFFTRSGLGGSSALRARLSRFIRHGQRRYLGGEKETQVTLQPTLSRAAAAVQNWASTGDYLADVINRRKQKHLKPSNYILFWISKGFDVGWSGVKRTSSTSVFEERRYISAILGSRKRNEWPRQRLTPVPRRILSRRRRRDKSRKWRAAPENKSSRSRHNSSRLRSRYKLPRKENTPGTVSSKT